MKRVLAFGYGIFAYLVFLGTFLYFIGFLGGFGVPKTVDSGPSAHPGWAVVVDLALIALFGVQHAIMARPAFKKRLTRILPEAVERSTFVLVASSILIMLFALWIPIPAIVWRVETPLRQLALHALFASGWLIVLYSSFLIDHFDLFGLRQVALYLKGQPYRPVPFKVASLYKATRHPMMLGFLIVLWATPVMTAGHLLLAAGFTSYIFIGIHFEERDLAEALGEEYRSYRDTTSMIIPKPAQGRRDTERESRV
jgi:protein-S-isoprenylcysteine O-methyltransferase Ste14